MQVQKKGASPKKNFHPQIIASDGALADSTFFAASTVEWIDDDEDDFEWKEDQPIKQESRMPYETNNKR